MLASALSAGAVIVAWTTSDLKRSDLAVLIWNDDDVAHVVCPSVLDERVEDDLREFACSICAIEEVLLVILIEASCLMCKLVCFLAQWCAIPTHIQWTATNFSFGAALAPDVSRLGANNALLVGHVVVVCMVEGTEARRETDLTEIRQQAQGRESNLTENTW